MQPMQVVSRKRTASQAHLAESEERAPKRRQPNNPRPLARPHHIKRFTPPPPKIKERPNFFSWFFSRVNDIWNSASPQSDWQTGLSSLTLTMLARCTQISTCLYYLIHTERTRLAPPNLLCLAHSPTVTIPSNSRRPQKVPTRPRHPIEYLQQVPAAAHARARHHRCLNIAKPNHRARPIRRGTPAFNRQAHRHPARIHITGLVESTRTPTTRRPAKVEKSGGRSR